VTTDTSQLTGWLVGNDTAPVHEFSSDQHTEDRGVHTFSIVNPSGVEGYYGYAGPVMGGSVDLWYSSDLRSWAQPADNPVIDKPGVRWPTAVDIDGTTYLAVRECNTGFSAQVADLVRRGKRRLWGTAAVQPMSIALYTSDDSYSFNRCGTFISPDDTGNVVNRNPFLFVDRRTDNPSLVYYSGDGSSYEIRHRSAKTVSELANASDTVLLRSDSLVAAPGIWYWPDAEIYTLFVEAFDTDRNVWITKLFVHEKLSSGFHEVGMLYPDNEACAFPHLLDGDLYVTTSRCLGSVVNGGIDADWEGRVYRYSVPSG
jgi:hypothetical protein